MIYALIGNAIFTTDTFKNVKNNIFGCFTDTIFNLLVLTSTVNFPDIMMEYYIKSRLSALFFMTFLILTYVIILNLLFANYYRNFKKFLQEI